jgi:hypothetical protein
LDHQDNHSWLSAWALQLQNERDQLRVKERLYSWARLITFIAAVTLWWPVADHTLPGLAIVGVFIGLFAVAVRRHRRVLVGREQNDRVLLMVNEALQRCGGLIVLIRSHQRPCEPALSLLNLPPVMDDGTIWQLTEQEQDDLDFYSPPVGLFGLLNRSSTIFGARRIRDMLERPCLSIDKIQARQQMVSWLSQNSQQRLRIMAAAADLRDQDERLEALTLAISRARPLPRPKRYWGIRMWSLISGSIIVFALIRVFMGQFNWFSPAIGLFVINGIIYLWNRATVTEFLQPWKNLSNVTGKLLTVTRQAKRDLPSQNQQPGLGLLQKCFADISPNQVLPLLSLRLGWVNVGGVIHEILNVLFFYDLHVLASILKPVLSNQDKLIMALRAMGDLEAVTSLACFAFESEPGCYPQVQQQPRVLSITAGRHPLVPPQRVIANHLNLDDSQRLCVVTGSNMSGKSTYLRMAATNCILAQIGTAALAERMTLSPVRLITDLNVRDNLAADESYFLAEVRHVRRMIVPQNEEATVLGLIDEPFRGTNSTEQVASAIAVAEYLLNSSNFTLIATHEHRLTLIAEKHDAAVNYHFQENLSADGLVFDYHIRPGPALTRNAIHVLEREEYPTELLARIRELLSDRAQAETK